MGKVFRIDKELEFVKVYDVPILIYDCTPSGYVESKSRYSDDKLYGLILQNIKDDNGNGKPRCPKLRKYTNTHIALEYGIKKYPFYVYVSFYTDIPDQLFFVNDW